MAPSQGPRLLLLCLGGLGWLWVDDPILHWGQLGDSHSRYAERWLRVWAFAHPTEAPVSWEGSRGCQGCPPPWSVAFLQTCVYSRIT